MNTPASRARAPALALATALCLAAGPALAQIAPPQVLLSPGGYPEVRGPDGAARPTGAASMIGLDAVTGAACLVGVTSTCQLPAQVGPLASQSSSLNGAASYAATGGTGAALIAAAPVQVAGPGARSLYHWHCANSVAQPLWLQLFDAAPGAVTLGVTPPKLSYPIPASGYWEEHYPGEERVAFANAITAAVTTTPTGAAGPATGAVCDFVFR